MARLRRVRLVLLGIAVVAGLLPVAVAQAGPPQENPQANAQGNAVTSGSTAMARARVAADVLMDSYDQQKAWFPSSWWNSAVALQTIGDYMKRTGDRRYLDQLDHTFETNKGPFPAGELSTDEIYGNFTSRAIDDSGWWGLNWISAYDLTGRQKYLNMAVTIAEFMNDFWDPSTCGGGIWWDEERTYKNAVTNGQWIRLTAELHNRIPGDTIWLQRSQEAWDWYIDSGMINSDGLVNDGLTDDCNNNGQTVYSYNQGLAIGAALELWRATHDPRLLASARRLADAAIESDALVSDGVLTESCDALDQSCSDNSKQFKGIFMRYLMDLADTTDESRYRQFVNRQAETIWEKDRDAANRLGTRWAGGTNAEHPNIFDWRTQASALSALIADIPETVPRQSLSATMSPAQPVVMPSSGAATQLRIDLGVAATSTRARSMDVNVNASGPDGWTVTPATNAIDLQPSGNAVPARGNVPVDITVPPDAQDGHYKVNATVTAKPRLRFTTQADILISRTVDFDTGTAGENPWLWDADGSGSNGPRNRFADGESYFVYRFPFPAETTSAEATLTIDNQYRVEAGSDGETWTQVLIEDQPVTDGSNKTDQTIDLTPYLGAEKTVYLRVSDSFPDDGWGGRVYHLSANHGTP